MKNVLLLIVFGLIGTAMVLCLKGFRGFPAVGALLDPSEGLYYTARHAVWPEEEVLSIEGLQGAVEVVRDERGVPHIFADHDLDAVTALGYVVAQDRLFQMDFIRRVAAGRLSEILGASLVSTDRFLRQTGMVWGGRKNLERILGEGGIERDIIQAYIRGVNARISSLAYKDRPFELKLIGYEPQLFTELDVLLVLQYMVYDLTYRSDDAVYRNLQQRIDSSRYDELYPRFATLFVPIIPEKGGIVPPQDRRPVYSTANIGSGALGDSVFARAVGVLAGRHARQVSWEGTPLEGYFEGKGSNNWVVGSERAVAGAPILAGDMHLSLWLPSIWYEAHLVSPSIDTYGVAIPGAPLPVEGFNDAIGWAFTNTGTDQIDHLALKLDASGALYEYEGEFKPLKFVPDTIYVKGSAPVVDTLMYAHWGPVVKDDRGAIATRWVAHDSSRTLRALWGMNVARSLDAFQEALRYWDTPMQNIVYGDVAGNIAIRSTGYLPVRMNGQGMGLLDGSIKASEWVGRVPFDELPYSFNPDQGYLSSTNQQPADSTYPYYLGHNWAPGYRSLRIDALLSGKERHAVDDLKRYQADVYAVQRDLFAPLLDSVDSLSEQAEELRAMLTRWEGETRIDRPEPIVLDSYLEHLSDLVWDEPVFDGLRRPNQERLYLLLIGRISPEWLDVKATPDAVEGAEDVMRMALEATVRTLEEEFGWERANWRWGKLHKVLFRHYTRSEALSPLWRGPFEYPGFAATLSPAASRTTTHSASWRMVVDFSTAPPTGYGIYPGGQSGNPFSPYYDAHIDAYIRFDHYNLARPDTPSDLPEEGVISRLYLSP